MGPLSRQELFVQLNALYLASPRSLESERVSKLEMARLLAILCLASVAVAQDSIYSTEDVEPGQYLQQPTANSLPEPAAAAPQQSRFQNFQQVEQQRSSPAYQQQQPRREQAYYQPAPQQPVQPAYQQPAFQQQTFQQPQQPQRAAYQQPAY